MALGGELGVIPVKKRATGDTRCVRKHAEIRMLNLSLDAAVVERGMIANVGDNVVKKSTNDDRGSVTLGQMVDSRDADSS